MQVTQNTCTYMYRRDAKAHTETQDTNTKNEKQRRREIERPSPEQ